LDSIESVAPKRMLSVQPSVDPDDQSKLTWI